MHRDVKHAASKGLFERAAGSSGSLSCEIGELCECKMRRWWCFQQKYHFLRNRKTWLVFITVLSTFLSTSKPVIFDWSHRAILYKMDIRNKRTLTHHRGKDHWTAGLQFNTIVFDQKQKIWGFYFAVESIGTCQSGDHPCSVTSPNGECLLAIVLLFASTRWSLPVKERK